jgi:riboflavin kinase / FMN adenylyltransferase
MRRLGLKFSDGNLIAYGEVFTFEGCVIALGNFDGIHLGHQKLLQYLLLHAEERRLANAVMVFDPHPVKFLQPDRDFLSIYSLEQKAQFLEQLGVKNLCILEFDDSVAQLSPEDFVKLVLAHPILNTQHIITGYNFHFGRQRVGDNKIIASLAQKYDMEYSEIDCVRSSHFEVSSTRIRQLLSCGCVRLASQLLGREYCVKAQVIRGHGLGKTQLGLATANLLLPQGNIQYPANGVYVVEIEHNGKYFKGVANLGLRPTIHSTVQDVHTHVLLEVHIFDCQNDLYDESLTIYFKDFLRPERKFKDLAQLKKQIVKDVQDARSCLDHKAFSWEKRI